jgi:signal peptidase I
MKHGAFRLLAGRKFLSSALLLVALAGLGRVFWMPVLILGSSMEPSYFSGEVIWMRKNQPQALRRFDIVLARTTWGAMTKRVIGLPGERVAMRDGIILINGNALEESFPVLRGSWTLAEGTLRPGCYLLIGDNRELPERAVFIVEHSQLLAGLGHSGDAHPQSPSKPIQMARTGQD